MKRVLILVAVCFAFASCSNKPKVSAEEAKKIIPAWKEAHNKALPEALRSFVENEKADKVSNSRETEGEAVKVKKARDMGFIPDKAKGELKSVKIIPSGKVRFLLAEYFSAPDKEYLSDLFLIENAGKLQYVIEGGTNENSIKIINPGKDAPDLVVVESFGGGSSVIRAFYAIKADGTLEQSALELKVWQEGGFGFADIDGDGVDEATLTTNAEVPESLLKLLGGEKEDWRKTILSRTESYKWKKGRFVGLGEYYH